MSSLVEPVTQSQHNSWIEIRRDRLAANLKTLKSFTNPGTDVMAIVKANAYGHGLLEIAAALAAQVSYFGVSSLREALELKEHRIETPVLIFGRLFNQELPAALMDGISLSASSFEEAKEISDLSVSLGRKTPLHVKVDTGMGRLGFSLRNAAPEIEKIAALDGLQLEGLYTHFPTAEQEDGFKEKQLTLFSMLLEELLQKGISFKYRHAANSAGILKTKNPALNLIRPGLMLYGIYPDTSLQTLAEISPILSLKSRVIMVKRLSAGETAGYGRTFVASQPATIGVLPIGYSHGYPFSASRGAEVLFRGKRYPLAGRVSMDYLTVNFGDDTVRAGDEVTLIGEDHGSSIRAEEMAAWAGTIPYEIVTRLLPSLPRLYR